MPRWSETDLRIYEQTRNMKSPTFVQESNAKADVKAEKELHRQIEQFLRLKGVRAIVHSRMDRKTTQAKGVPDFLFCWKGKPTAMELKTGNNTLSDEQVKWIGEMYDDGWKVGVVRSLDDCIKLLSEPGEPR